MVKMSRTTYLLRVVNNTRNTRKVQGTGAQNISLLNMAAELEYSCFRYHRLCN